ncbi:MAG: 16S rRNA (guanine(966)-N(2))-methyltransferase RsmD [Clostridia bacterium]|nr:16S rRNA (guanine(966)-N(2))-methyltransferase RsmD [Clostridia bacterium]
MLRVISGSARGHKLKTPKGSSTRPTTDRVKESLFNIIAAYIPEAEVLDLFAGTGNLGIEALSRGAANAVFADKSAECVNIIKDNLNHTKLSDKAKVLSGDASMVLMRLKNEGKRFDLIFLDPPYNTGLAQEMLSGIAQYELLKTDGLIVAESDRQDTLPENVGNLRLIRQQKYGDTMLWLYKYGLDGNEN